MSSARSSRSRKIVNYAALCDDGISDDDFAPSATSSQIKKAKLEKSTDKKITHTESRKQTVAETIDNNRSAASAPTIVLTRLSRDDKWFQKNVEKAIAESLHSSPEQPSLEVEGSASTVEEEKRVDSCSASFKESLQEQNEETEQEAEWNEGSESSSVNEGSNSSEDEDEDHFSSKKKVKKKTVLKKVSSDKNTSKNKTKSPVVRTRTVGKEDSPKSALPTKVQNSVGRSSGKENSPKSAPLIKVENSTTVTKNPATPFAGSCSSSKLSKTPYWSPPARLKGLNSSSSQINSPSSISGIRLGLSRNIRVKPLHSSVTVKL